MGGPMGISPSFLSSLSDDCDTSSVYHSVHTFQYPTHPQGNLFTHPSNSRSISDTPAEAATRLSHTTLEPRTRGTTDDVDNR